MIPKQTTGGLLYLSLCGSIALCFFIGIYRLLKQPQFLTNRRIFTTEENQVHTTRGCLLSALFLLPCLKPVLSPSLLISLGLLYSFLFVPFATGVYPTNNALTTYVKNQAIKFSSYLSDRTLDVLLHSYHRLNLFFINIISYYITSTHFQNVVASEFFTFIYCSFDGYFNSKRTTFQLKLSLIFGIYLLVKSKKLGLKIREYIREINFSWIGLKHLTWMVLASLVVIDGGMGIISTITSDPVFSLVNFVYFVCTEVDPEGTASGDHPLVVSLKKRKFEVLQELEPLWVPAILKSLPIFMSLLGIILGLTNGIDHSIKTKVILTLPASFFTIYNPLRQLRVKTLIPLQRELKSLHRGFPAPSPEQLEAYGTACPICMDNMSSASRILPCKHIFHSFCIMKCLRSSQICPVCRQKVTLPNTKG